MDHLPAISNLIPQELKVCYLRSEISRSSPGFWGFLEDHGWHTEKIEIGLFGRNPRVLVYARKDKPKMTSHELHEVAVLLQEWFYFGMLSEVLQSQVSHQDFMTEGKGHERLVVTTARLSIYLHEWEQRLAKAPPLYAAEQLEQAKKCIDFVHVSMDNLGNLVEGRKNAQICLDASGSTTALETMIDQREQIDAPSFTRLILDALEAEDALFWKRYARVLLPEELELSILILGHTLMESVYRIKSRLSIPDTLVLHNDGIAWYTPKFIHDRLIREGVCPRVIENLQSSISLIGMLLASCLDLKQSMKSMADHSKCNSSRCEEEYLVGGKAPRRHNPGLEGCSCKDFPPRDWYECVLERLEAGEIPVLRVQSYEDKLDVEVMSSAGLEYVAFSHIWSDGLGNESFNQLYVCQWLRLQTIVDRLFPGRPPGSVPFWLDTICVPAVPQELRTAIKSTEGDRRRKMRNYAIQRMRDTYSQALNVVILDSTMWGYRAEGRSPIEFGIRFSFSRWMQRLWTMHEGAVARDGRCWVWTINGAVSLAQSFVTLANMRDQEENSTHVPLLSGLGIVEAYQAWTRCLHVEADNIDVYRHHLFSFVWNVSRKRATKYEEDRYVVVASLLGIGKPQDLYGCSDSQEMTRLILNRFPHDSIPASLLFTESPRMSVPGFRWAPRSIEVDLPIAPAPWPAVTLTAEGLVVELKSCKLSRHSTWATRQTPRKSPAGQSGCPMRCSILSKAGEVRWLIHDLSQDSIFVLTLMDPKTDVQQCGHGLGSKLYIIRQPNKQQGKSSDRAILVAGVGDEIASPLRARFIAALWLTEVTEMRGQNLRGLLERGRVTAYAAEAMNEDAKVKWCID